MARWIGRHWRSGDAVEVTTSGGVISAIEACDVPDEDRPWIGPGLIDLQVNGIAGFDLNRGEPSPANLLGTVGALHREGVTRFCPTVSTNSEEHLIGSIAAIVEACASDRAADHAVVGIHVEGPFISAQDGPRGVHNPRWVRPPDWAEFLRWQEAATGRIRMVTLAPELPGAIDFIARLVQSGVIAAIGHSAATEDQVRAAVEAGATMSTHLGNGAHPMLKRHPNYIWAQLAEDRLWAGLIGDGFHLPASTLKTMIRAKGEKAVLVSDVGYLGLQPPGRYGGHHWSEVVLEPGGRLHIADNPELLAGSASSLRAGVQNVAALGILPFDEAFGLASERPAQLLDVPGGLRVGAPADLVLFDWAHDELTVSETVVDGRTVYAA
jgi:N-acetylglucosamine-6-phosphate deacetylase